MFKSLKRKSTILKSILVLIFVAAILMVTPNSVKAETTEVVDKVAGQTVSELNVHVLTTGDAADQAKRTEYEVRVESNKEELIMPLVAEAAGVMQVFFTDDSYNLDVEFYSDPACTKAIDYNSNNAFGVIPKAGTYYVKFVNSYGDYGATDSVTLKAAFSCQLYPETSALKDGKWQSAGVTDYTRPVYFKLDVSQNALVEIDFQAENTNSRITLCNSSKKAITEDTTVSSLEGKKAFVVAKGSYYIKVTTNAWWVRVKSSVKSVSDSSGSSKSKAADLKLGTAKGGVVFLEDKTSMNDWFKFTLTKPTKLNLIMSGNVSAGYIRYELTSTKIEGSLTGYLGDVGNSDEAELNYYKNGKLQQSLPAGTYYIRVYKDSAKTCGNYFVKVSQR